MMFRNRGAAKVGQQAHRMNSAVLQAGVIVNEISEQLDA